MMFTHFFFQIYSSSAHETIPTCGAHCISRCHKRPISLLEEDRDHIISDTNKRPKLSSQCECSWKDVPGKSFLGKKFPSKDMAGTFLIRDKEISSISSGSSAPAVTEISVETDKECEVGPAGLSVAVPMPVDEASLVEKCGSSDEKHELCTIIQPSLSRTNTSSTLKRESSPPPTASMANKLCNDVRLVKRDKKLVEPVHNRPMKRSETKEVISMNRKEKLVDQAHRIPEYHPRMNKADLEKKRKEKSVCLVHCEPVNNFETSETFSEKKKVESLVDQVHHGPKSFSKTSDALSEDREETSVSLVHHRSMSCFKAKATFSEKNREIKVDAVCHGPMNHLEARKQPKYKYLNQIGIKGSETKNKNSSHPFCAIGKKPIVCGNFGIISNGMTNDALKPIKIVSLISVLERTKTSYEKILEPEKLSPLTSEKPRTCDLKRIKGLAHNSSKNGASMVKPALSQLARKGKNIKLDEFGEYSGKIKRVKMKSISLDVMDREGISKSEDSPKEFTGNTYHTIHISQVIM
jgi:hypothetical protein